MWGVDPADLPGPGRSASELLNSLGQADGPRVLLVFGSNVVVSARHTSSSALFLGATALPGHGGEENASGGDATATLKWDLRGSTPTTEVNGEVTYTLSVRNVGSGPATNVRPTITLPPEMAFLKAQPLMHKAEGPRVLFDPVTLPAGAEAI